MIRQRGNRWQVDVFVNGERVRRSAATEEAAAELEATLLAEKAAAAGPKQKTLSELLGITWRRYWVNTKDGRGSYRRSELVLDDMQWHDRTPDTITRRDLLQLMDYYRDEGNTDATINRKLVAVTRLLTTAIEEGLIEHRPFVKQLRERNGRTRFLTVDEERRILICAEQLEYTAAYQLIVFLVDTGCRVSEALSLRPCDVDAERSTVHFADTKNGESRTVPMTKRAAAAVLKWGLLEYPKFYSQFIRCLSMAGVNDPQVCIHTLRHTCASRLVQRGVDLRIVKDWMGHKSITVTMRYAHLMLDNLMNAKEVLEPTKAQQQV